MQIESFSELSFMAGGGEMGAMMRAYEWSKTPLGPVKTWPQSLRTSVSTCLECAFPILLWWGPELVMLYNDEYRMVLGSEKHPQALGSAGRMVFPEIWDVIGPMLNQVISEGRATRSRDLRLVMNRHGYDEESYFSFSYSPIRDETGGVGGVFTPVFETTERVIGERRLRTLRDLAARSRPDSIAAAATAAAEAFADNPFDAPFVLIYRIEEDGEALLAAAAGIAPGAAAAPVALNLDSAGAWPVEAVVRTGAAMVVDDLTKRFSDLPTGAWSHPPRQAVLSPITLPGRARPTAVMITAVSPCRALDDDYRSFFDLAAGQFAKTLAEVLAYDEERRRAQALAEIDRAKTQFFSNVSHEFRTPLTLILGPLEEMLEADPDTPQQVGRECLNRAHRNGLRLLRLVNSLLDFSRIEAGRARATFAPTDLGATTADLAANFRAATERAGLRLLVETEPMGQPVYVDREMWEKIVLNLISNAFKFTFEGEIAVVVAPSPDGRQACLTVRDTGVGISPRERPRLFQRFHRVEGARGRSIEGSGIGLALVQELVRLHGGAVDVVSEEGVGSAFTVTLPFGKAHLPADQVSEQESSAAPAGDARGFVEEALRWLPTEADAPPLERAEPADAPPSDGRRILVADDNADMRGYLRRLLEARGYEVEDVCDGLSALTAATRRAPDLVLTDVMMPGLDGFGLVKRLRALPEGRELPVVLLSARAGEDARIEGLQAGADDYMVKPFSARELYGRVEAVLRRSDVRREASRAIREENLRMRQLFEQAPGFMAIVSGPNHRFEFANESYRHLVGGRALIGKSVAEAFPEVAGQGVVERLDRVYGTGERHVGRHTPLVLKGIDGEEPATVYLDFIFQPIRDAAGQIEGIFIEGYDVSNRRRYEQHLHLLIEELNHRVKNTLAIVQGLAQQTFRGEGDPQERRRAFDGRLAALACAHDLLNRENWESADLKSVAQAAIAPHGDIATRCLIDGPIVRLEPKTAVTLAMAFHELSTNAVKYGALSVQTGRIDIVWQVERSPQPRLCLHWRERGGPAVAPPTRRGFGSRMIERALASELQGQVTLKFRSGGLECEIAAPLPRSGTPLVEENMK